MKKIVKYIYLIAFTVIISLIGILTVLNIDRPDQNEIATIEKRQPVKRPVWKWNKYTMTRYFNQLDSYINDNFSLRTKLTRIYSKILYSAGISAKPGKVIIGKNGMLFLGNDFNKVIDQTYGKRLLTNVELSQLKTYFSSRQLFVDTLGIPFYLVILPNKETIYSEYLPYSDKPSKKCFLTQISDPDFGVNVISLQDAVMKGKIQYRDLLYYKTDSHWSEIGAYLAYDELIKQIHPKFPKLNSLHFDKNNFNIVPYYGRHDLKDMLYLNISIPDFAVCLSNFHNWDLGLMKIDETGIEKEMASTQNVSTFEHCVIINPNKPYTLLLFKDSFSWNLSPYLNNTFGKIIYCYYQNFGWNQYKELVKKYKPDLVLYETIQRELPTYASISARSLEEMKETKNVEWSSIKKFFGKDLLSGVKGNYQIDELNVINNDFCFESIGNDPHFILPPINIPSRKKVKIEVVLDVPNKTIAQIFYIIGHEAHNGKQSISQNIKEGFSSIDFLVPEKNIDGSKLRFDPGSELGWYKISSVEVFISD